jgi:uncharacterized protein with Zn-ribbon domain DUF2116
MPNPSAADPGARPGRDGSRHGSASVATGSRHCPVCRAPIASTRARYCSDACKQRAYRLRQPSTADPDLTTLTAELTRLRERVAHTIYECPLCGERSLGERRCPDCHRFRRALGLGGACPACDEPILIAELLGREVGH